MRLFVLVERRALRRLEATGTVPFTIHGRVAPRPDTAALRPTLDADLATAAAVG